MDLPFKTIYETAAAGGASSLPQEIDGKTYVRLFRPRERLLLLGGGHVSQPLCRYAADLGFLVTVADDRPDFANRQRFPEADAVICDDFTSVIGQWGISGTDYVAVITRGHRYDADCVRKILSGEARPRYLGMIGSRRRVISLLDMLEDEGFSREDLDRIHAPIGIDIHALTLNEIAVSIAAELIQCRRKDGRRSSKEALLVSDDIDLPLLERLALDDTPKALLLVYETSGSTPVKSGAMMTVDKALQTVGTVGGGCSEGALLREAFRMIGTGERRCVTVDMSNDVAEEEGMVCGGKMKVLLWDLSRPAGHS